MAVQNTPSRRAATMLLGSVWRSTQTAQISERRPLSWTESIVCLISTGTWFSSRWKLATKWSTNWSGCKLPSRNSMKEKTSEHLSIPNGRIILAWSYQTPSCKSVQSRYSVLKPSGLFLGETPRNLHSIKPCPAVSEMTLSSVKSCPAFHTCRPAAATCWGNGRKCKVQRFPSRISTKRFLGTSLPAQATVASRTPLGKMPSSLWILDKKVARLPLKPIQAAYALSSNTMARSPVSWTNTGQGLCWLWFSRYCTSTMKTIWSPAPSGMGWGCTRMICKGANWAWSLQRSATAARTAFTSLLRTETVRFPRPMRPKP